MLDAPSTPSAGTLAEPKEPKRVPDQPIPTFWTETEGQCQAGLLIRSGRNLEPLALGGITHLVWHLVADALRISAHGPGSYRDLDVTGQSFTGDPEEVGMALSALSIAISVPPVEDLPAVIETTKEELADWRPGAREHLLRLRHGATGPGALNFEEYSLRKAGHVQIQNWVARHMHMANAALWISGPMPERLKLRSVKGPPTKGEASLLDVPTPGYAYCSPGTVGISMLAPNTHALSAAVRMAHEQAHHELCTTRSAVNSLNFTLLRHDKNDAEILIVAECPEGREDEVMRVLLWALDSVATIPPPASRINEYRNDVAQNIFRPDSIPDRTRSAAIDYLLGLKTKSWAQTYEELNDLSGPAISQELANAMTTTLAVGPRNCFALQERFKYVESWTPSKITGAACVPIKLPHEDKPDRELVIGRDGLSVREGECIYAVRYDECALVLRGDDGYRELISETGSRLVFIRDAWEHGQQVLEQIDRASTPDQTIVLESGDTQRGYSGIERRRWPR